MFEFLIDSLEKNSYLYVPILNKLIANKLVILEEVLLVTLGNLMKKNKSYCLHII